MTRTWTDTQITEAVLASHSIASVARALGLKPNGGSYKTIKAHIARLNLSTEHFTGQAWNSGASYVPPRAKQDLAAILVENSTFTSSWHLKRRLLAEGVLEYRCAACGKTEVHNPFTDTVVPVPLELDHINGVNTDNRLENLRLLDPICHSFTDTYRGKNARVAQRQEAGDLKSLQCEFESHREHSTASVRPRP